jgi:cyclopropane fatty-acyl-phospholipid synthase-like methyltransferase
MEEPAVHSEIGPVEGRRILDLGCGDGAFGRWLIDEGARHYQGVDSSAAMVARATHTLSGSPAQIRHGKIEDFGTAAGSVDLIVSRLALHYIEPLEDVLRRCRTWLAPGGRLLITVVHPVITSHDARASTEERRTNWVVDNYFDTTARPQTWMGADVVFHHRTVEQYFSALRTAGFTVTALRECAPARGAFDDNADEYARRRRIPLFLLLAANADGD